MIRYVRTKPSRASNNRFALLSINRKAVASSSPGCRFGYPGIANENVYSTAKRLRHNSSNQRRRNRGWASEPFPTQGSRSGNPGLKGGTALRFYLLRRLSVDYRAQKVRFGINLDRHWCPVRKRRVNQSIYCTFGLRRQVAGISRGDRIVI